MTAFCYVMLWLTSSFPITCNDVSLTVCVSFEIHKFVSPLGSTSLCLLQHSSVLCFLRDPLDIVFPSGFTNFLGHILFIVGCFNNA